MPAGPGPPTPAGRSSSTEAASRGVTGSFRPLRTSRAGPARSAGRRRIARPGTSVLAGPSPAGSVTRRVTDLGDQLDLHGRVEREDRHADGAAGVPARLTEHLENQLAG